VVDGGEPGVDSRDEGKHTGRNDLLFVEKMMWMGVLPFTKNQFKLNKSRRDQPDSDTVKEEQREFYIKFKKYVK